MKPEDVNKIIEVYDEVIADLKQENQQLKNDNAFMKANLIQIHDERLEHLKSTLEEIREYINSNCDFNGTALYDKWVAGKAILQIIDKGVNNE